MSPSNLSVYGRKLILQFGVECRYNKCLTVCRKFAVFLRRFPSIRTDVVGLLDEWAARFFEELDYVREGNNGIKFAKQMEKDLPQVIHVVVSSTLLRLRLL